MELESVLKAQINKAQKQAGPRYTPAQFDKKGFPTIPIKTLDKSFQGLARTKSFWDELQELTKKLEAETGNNLFLHLDRYNLEEPKTHAKLANEQIPILISELNNIFPNKEDLKYSLPLKELLQKIDSLRESLQAGQDVVSSYRNLPKDEYEKIKEACTVLSEAIRKLLSQTYSLSSFFRDEASTLFNQPSVLLIGSAGMGKTHFLCDFAERFNKSGGCVVIVLAQFLNPQGNDLLKSIIDHLKIEVGKKEFLEGLKKSSILSKRRSLILIDAINEAERHLWKAAITQLLSEISAYPEIGIVISCRAPFHYIVLPKRPKPVLTVLEHRGFDEVELDAQEAFFKFYKLPNTEVPLLYNEFSTPLFLKLFCESLHSTVVKKKHPRIKEIASGQEGMTKIFEDYIDHKQDVINQKVGKNKFKTANWLWDGLIKEGIAERMAAAKVDFVTPKDLKECLGTCIKDKRNITQVRKLLISEDVIATGIVWDENNKPIEIIRFPYQKLSDHLIVRTALSKIDYRNKDEVKKLFASWEKLPHLIEALMIDWPDRASGNEILDFCEDGVSRDLAYSFIQGLYWRKPTAFNERTDEYINWFLKEKDLSNSLLKALFSLACKSKHPISSSRLSSYLKSLSLPNRDLLWSEFIRNQYSDSPVYKILDWVNEARVGRLNGETSRNYLTLLQWLLTSTRRPIRDRATKAIYILGIKNPDTLFELVQQSFEINDLYVPERLTAALFGVAMALHTQTSDKKRTRFVNETLPVWADWLFKNVLKSEGKYATTHSLIRDYCRGINELSIHHGKAPKTRWRYILKNGMPNKSIKAGTLWFRDKEAMKESGGGEYGYSPYIHMDSGKYILSNISHDDDNGSILLDTVARVTWKMKRMGWSEDRFKEIDREIEDDNFWRVQRNGEKIKCDRYGKKYMWICYYELRGYHSFIYKNKGGYMSRNESNEDDMNLRRDIDPSLPKSPLKLKVVKKSLLGGPRDTKKWLMSGIKPDIRDCLKIDVIKSHDGPWITLNGHIDEDDGGKNKKIFIFIRGLLFEPKHLEEFEKVKGKIIYPGNELFPDTQRIEEVFQGEIPWSVNYPTDKYPDEIKIIEQKRFRLSKKQKQKEDEEHAKRMASFFKIKEDIKNGTFSIEIPDVQATTPFMQIPQERDVIPVEVPVASCSWGAQDTVIQEDVGVDLPTRTICDSLGLYMKNGEMNMYTPDGRIAFIPTDWGKGGVYSGHNFSFLRKDLLDEYLKKTGKVFAWYVWGERQGSINRGENREYSDIYRTYKQVHKQFIKYKSE